MASSADHLAQAQRHVDSGRGIIARQRLLIEGQIARGADTTVSARLLSMFERTQAVFEEDLATLKSELI